MELIFNPCGEFRWSPEGPVSQIQSPHLHAGVPGTFSDLLRSVQMLKRTWGVESNGKLPHLSIHSKTATWVPELTVEDLSLSRTVASVPEFAVKDLPLGRILWWYVCVCVCVCVCITAVACRAWNAREPLFPFSYHTIRRNLIESFR